MRGYELSDFEWRVIAPLLPNKPRGVPRVDDRRVLNGIFWVLRTGAPWRALPKEFGPRTTCYNRFVWWRKAGVWDRILAAVTIAYDGEVQMIDSTSVRVHQHLVAPIEPGTIGTRSVNCPKATRPMRSFGSLHGCAKQARSPAQF